MTVTPVGAAGGGWRRLEAAGANWSQPPPAGSGTLISLIIRWSPRSNGYGDGRGGRGVAWRGAA